MRPPLLGGVPAGIPKNGLLAHWPCTDASGPLTDLLGVNPGTLGASTAAPTLDGTKVTFDGVNDVITTSLQLGSAGTLIVACSPPSLPAGTKAIMGVANGASGQGYLGILATGKARLAVGTVTLDSIATAYTAGGYTLHAGGWDGTTMEVFINGVLDRTGTQSGNPLAVGVYLGCDNGNGTASLFVNASIAYALAYNRKLSRPEQARVYRALQALLAARGLTI